MSWFDDLVDFGKNLLTGNGLGSQVLKTVVTGYALNKVTKSINKSNDAARERSSGAGTNIVNVPGVDKGVRITGLGDVKAKIPVVYGSAFTGGKIIDADMTDGGTVMWYALAICERTGNLLSSGAPSQFSVGKVYYNNQRVQFKSDGVTVDYCVDANGNVDFSLSDLVKIYFFAGNSNKPVAPAGYSLAANTPAYNLMPGWTTNHLMGDLVFMLVRVKYNRDQNVTGLGNISAQIINSMNMPGDCMYDYMTNTRYGAGLNPENIKGL